MKVTTKVNRNRNLKISKAILKS